MRKMFMDASKEVRIIIFDKLMQGLREIGPYGHQL
jgi:hypothetical protein